MHARGVERILLAVDGGQASTVAIPQMAALARSLRARVRLVHVGEVLVHVGEPAPGSETRTADDDLLERAAGAFRSAGVEVEACLRHPAGGGLGQDIGDAADEWGADLVALGSGGAGDLDAMLRGSVSHEVLTRVRQPVLVLRGSPQGSVPRRLLVASEGGDQAPLAAAAALLAQAGAEVVVLHVGRIASAMEAAFIEPEARALEVAEAAAGAIREAGLKATAEVRWGPIAYSITEAARERDCDLIVLASRPPSDLTALLLGSVTQQVIQRSLLPVLVAGRSL